MVETPPAQTLLQRRSLIPVVSLPSEVLNNEIGLDDDNDDDDDDDDDVEVEAETSAEADATICRQVSGLTKKSTQAKSKSDAFFSAAHCAQSIRHSKSKRSSTRIA